MIKFILSVDITSFLDDLVLVFFVLSLTNKASANTPYRIPLCVALSHLLLLKQLPLVLIEMHDG